MNTAISLVAKLKQQAKTARDFEDYPAATGALDEALKLLQGEEQGLAALPESEQTPRRLEIERQLADCYGMKGGLYRRMAMNSSERDALLEKAEQMYQQGARYERDDSYNLTNTIVIPLIRNPERLSELQPKILEARAIVQGQVQSTRATQWWAWADLALLDIFAGDLTGALQAYAQFARAGAQARDYQSTVKVLQDLETVWQADEIKQHLADAIAFLDRQKVAIS